MQPRYRSATDPQPSGDVRRRPRHIVLAQDFRGGLTLNGGDGGRDGRHVLGMTPSWSTLDMGEEQQATDEDGVFDCWLGSLPLEAFDRFRTPPRRRRCSSERRRADRPHPEGIACESNRGLKDVVPRRRIVGERQRDHWRYARSISSGRRAAPSRPPSRDPGPAAPRRSAVRTAGRPSICSTASTVPTRRFSLLRARPRSSAAAGAVCVLTCRTTLLLSLLSSEPHRPVLAGENLVRSAHSGHDGCRRTAGTSWRSWSPTIYPEGLSRMG